MKSRNLFIGILVLFTGVVALLSALGVIDFHWSIVWKLWPMLLIVIGIALLPLNDYVKGAILLAALGVGCLLYHAENRHYQGSAVTRFFNRHFSQWDWDWDDDDDQDDADDPTKDDVAGFLPDQHFAEAFRDVERASMDIDFGAGNLKLATPCAELAKVDINSNFVQYSFRSEGGDNEASFHLSGKGATKHLHGKSSNTNDIELALCAQPVWDFSLDMGAASADLDFTPYLVSDLEINGGACDLDLKLGDSGFDTQVEINTGASDIDILVPSGMDCEVRIESAITGKDFKGFEKIERGLWRTPGYGQGTHHITIEIDCAVSDISIEQY
ncbi:MAG: hypothetical protein J5831_05610 [Bacteroidales bacterium]|nr:hypothetical protein [Bacteroidales bacterium]